MTHEVNLCCFNDEQMTANVTAEVRVYRKYYRDVVAIVRKVCCHR